MSLDKDYQGDGLWSLVTSDSWLIADASRNAPCEGVKVDFFVMLLTIQINVGSCLWQTVLCEGFRKCVHSHCYQHFQFDVFEIFVLFSFALCKGVDAAPRCITQVHQTNN